MGILKQLAAYITFKKVKTKEKPDTYLKLMHGMNRISIIVFLLALLFLFFRWLFKH